MDTARFDSDDPVRPGWRARLGRPMATLAAGRLEEVAGVVAEADRAAREGCWVALAVTYEAAGAFEPAVPPAPRPPAGPPLAWAAVFRDASGVEAGPATTPGPGAPAFEPGWTEAQFVERAQRAQARIADGDTYQVNLTFPMHAGATPDPAAWYAALRDAQRAPFAACLDMGRHVVLSLSPELFFQRQGPRVITRPMKGTAPRGRWLAEDERVAAELARSTKVRAENIMIADLLRNDLGRVAVPGSVRVPALCVPEQYPTLWQLTSTIEADLPPSTSLLDLFGALFPCGSVTGAPKISTMRIIDALEGGPRGLYTGAIGLLRPGGDCTFSVAIRTLVIDRETGHATLGVGAGITADSVPELEYQESLLKAAFAQPAPAPDAAGDFSLLETMRLDEGRIARRDRHQARLTDSARYFGRPCDPIRVDEALERAAREHPAGRWRLRLLVDRTGAPTATATPYVPDRGPWRVALAGGPVDERDPFLCNKTTRRGTYDRARRMLPHVEDVLLWNRRGEVTEATLGNVVAEIDGVRWTPPLECGLLGGTFRGELLERGEVRERVLRRADVARATRLWIVNSVREWIEAVLVR